MSFGVRDIRNLYPRITENHLRYLEKWGLIRSAATRGGGEFTFNEVATIKQLAGELERDVPLKTALRTLMGSRSRNCDRLRPNSTSVKERCATR